MVGGCDSKMSGPMLIRGIAELIEILATGGHTCPGIAEWLGPLIWRVYKINTN